MFTTLGAPERRGRLSKRKQRRPAEPEPDPALVSTGRATIIDVGLPLESESHARAWLADAGEEYLNEGLSVLNRALHAFRLVTADPYVNSVGRDAALVARIGYGGGDQVADGLWTDALELEPATERQRRAKVLTPQARLAAVLGGRERALACEDLTLRARLDIDQGREREAALQVLVALDATIAEIGTDPTAPKMPKRLDELRSLREAVTTAGQQALAGRLDEDSHQAVEFALQRIEAILRARAVINA
ncbi:MAG: hypothetical protein M3Z06_15660 [Actinomycetota bacterium]|nr:hypothetical protein [Actinomycetota bacterium]